MSFTVDIAPQLDAKVLALVRQNITDFVEGRSDYVDAVRTFTELVGSSNPIDKLHEILTLPDEPIPETKLEISKEDSTQRKKTRSWTSHEDMRLLAGVHKHGLDSWSNVSHFVGNGRSRSQCSQRWLRVLDPKISKDQWTSNESAMLLSLVAQYGEKSWMKVATELGNRSDVQCRYHYQQLQREDRARRSKNPEQPHQEPEVQDAIERPIDPPPRKQEPIDPPPPPPPPEQEPEQEREAPIPLSTCLNLQKSDPLFDSNWWLLRDQ